MNNLSNTDVYRNLTTTEVGQLTQQGCMSSSWEQVLVSPIFNVSNVRNTQFSGLVKIGDNTGTIDFSGGIIRNCGIYNANIHNCTIGDHVYIHQITNYIANYDIQDHVILENIEICFISGETCFGNGIKVSTLDETGGRRVMIYDKLSDTLPIF